MSDEPVLSDAARSLREVPVIVHGASGSAATRSRIVATLARQRRGRTRSSAVAITVLAVALGSSAWAATTRTSWRQLVASMRARGSATAQTAPAHTRATRSVTEPAKPATVTTVATVTVDAPTIALVAAPSPVDAPRAMGPGPLRIARANHPVRVPLATATEIARPDPEALFREAHRAHFVTRDPASAVRAFEQYLALAPDGRFAPEARYNRALDLIRLGRTGEAITALAPLAAGADGTYRQHEATTLLRALRNATRPAR